MQQQSNNHNYDYIFSERFVRNVFFSFDRKKEEKTDLFQIMKEREIEQ